MLPPRVSWEGKGSCSLVAVKRKDGEGGSSREGAGGQWGERGGGPWGWGAPAGNEVVRLDDEEVEGSSGHSSWVGAVRHAGGQSEVSGAGDGLDDGGTPHHAGRVAGAGAADQGVPAAPRDRQVWRANGKVWGEDPGSCT